MIEANGRFSTFEDLLSRYNASGLIQILYSPKKWSNYPERRFCTSKEGLCSDIRIRILITSVDGNIDGDLTHLIQPRSYP
jgi:hypothetical protein